MKKINRFNIEEGFGSFGGLAGADEAMAAARNAETMSSYAAGLRKGGFDKVSPIPGITKIKPTPFETLVGSGLQKGAELFPAAVKGIGSGAKWTLDAGLNSIMGPKFADKRMQNSNLKAAASALDDIKLQRQSILDKLSDDTLPHIYFADLPSEALRAIIKDPTNPLDMLNAGKKQYNDVSFQLKNAIDNYRNAPGTNPTSNEMLHTAEEVLGMKEKLSQYNLDIDSAQKEFQRAKQSAVEAGTKNSKTMPDPNLLRKLAGNKLVLGAGGLYGAYKVADTFGSRPLADQLYNQDPVPVQPNISRKQNNVDAPPVNSNDTSTKSTDKPSENNVSNQASAVLSGTAITDYIKNGIKKLNKDYDYNDLDPTTRAGLLAGAASVGVALSGAALAKYMLDNIYKTSNVLSDKCSSIEDPEQRNACRQDVVRNIDAKIQQAIGNCDNSECADEMHSHIARNSTDLMDLGAISEGYLFQKLNKKKINEIGIGALMLLPQAVGLANFIYQPIKDMWQKYEWRDNGCLGIADPDDRVKCQLTLIQDSMTELGSQYDICLNTKQPEQCKNFVDAKIQILQKKKNDIISKYRGT